MSDMPYSRRDFIKGLSATGIMGASLGVLGGCSAPAKSTRSYLTSFMRSDNRSSIFVWTDIMLQAMRNQAITPPHASRAFAMAHTAGFLAINGIQGGYNTPYQVEKGPQGANAEIAYGVAFSSALSEALQSSFIFDRNNFLSGFADSEAKSQAIKYGRHCADVVIKARVNDGAEPNKADFYLGRYPRRDDVLRWAPTGPFYGAEDGPFLGTFHRGHVPGWGAVKPWVMRRKRAFLAKEFLDPKSPEFAREFLELKDIGAADSKTRTDDEMEIAFFWEDGPRGVTPPGHWQIVAMNVTQDMNMSLLEQARMFALLSIGQADAAITAWDSKYTYDIVRPETMIRFRADDTGNSLIAGQGQSNWRSLIFTPDFPTYTSGHSTFSGVSARIIANVIGRDRVSFSAEAADLVNWPKYLTGVRRSWTSLWQAAEENGASRIYGGVHWNIDNTEGLRVGRDLGDYVYKNAFHKAV